MSKEVKKAIGVKDYDERDRSLMSFLPPADPLHSLPLSPPDIFPFLFPIFLFSIIGRGCIDSGGLRMNRRGRNAAARGADWWPRRWTNGG